MWHISVEKTLIKQQALDFLAFPSTPGMADQNFGTPSRPLEVLAFIQNFDVKVGPLLPGLPFYPQDGGSEFWYAIPTVRDASFHPKFWLAILGEEGFLILLNI